ncbi:MAG: hypothetical protein RR500_00845 [Bacilli bacterium]
MRLFEYIYENTSINDISDLRSKRILKENIRFIEDLEVNWFSLNDWIKVCNYITGHKLDDIHKASYVKQFILNWIMC